MSKKSDNTNPFEQLITTLQNFFKDSRSSGILLITCTVISLVLANNEATGDGYLGFWKKEFSLPISFLHLPDTYLLLVNDVLMTFFFFLVGMEIKRELTIGELASFQKALMPAIAAVGGIVCPAMIFLLFNGSAPTAKGWAIPMATDIAFSLGILSLLGNKVPVQLKIFLTALAIIDDLGAIITLAVFYTSSIHLVYLTIALVLVAALWGLQYIKNNSQLPYLILGIGLWYVLFNSGIHATIAGVITAFCLPLNLLAKLEHQLFHPVNFVIMPLFALANTGIALPDNFSAIYTSPITYGVVAGLVIGKPLGIFLFSFIAAKLKIATLPSNTKWLQLLGVGMLAGIGFTMSIFTVSLSYSSESLQIIAKVAIIAASIIASFFGFVFLYYNRMVKY